MAETEKKTTKKSSAAPVKKNGTAARGGGGSTPKTKQATSASKAPAKKKDAPRKDQDGGQVKAKIKRKNEFALQFVPYILAVVVIFLGACFIMDAIGQAETADQHLMGFVGFYVCQGLFGCLGWSAYLIPLFIVNLAIFWRRNYDEGRNLSKIILSVVTLIFVASVTHVAACSLNESLAAGIDLLELYTTGAALEGGGVIGGVLGYLLYLALRLPGTIVLAVLVFPLLIMYLVGVTPSLVFGKLGRFCKNSWQRSSEERAIRRAEKAEARAYEEDEDYDYEEEDEDGEDEEPVRHASDRDTKRKSTESKKSDRKADTADAYRERRAKVNARAEAEMTGNYEDPAEDDLPFDADDDDMGMDHDENVVVNTRTGEVLGPEKTDKTDKTDKTEKNAKTDRTSPDQGREEKGKSRKDKKKEAKSASTDDREDGMETAGLPLFDTAAAQPVEEPPVDDEPPFDMDPEYTQLTVASVLEDYADEELDPETETMEVGYDDDFDGEVPEGNMTRGGVKYEVVTDNGEATPRTPSQPKKNDPYATVRILKSESSAVAEAGLSEEEVVISSATQNPDQPEGEEAEEAPAREYVFPPVDLLTKGSSRYEANEEEIAENTQALREVLESFRIGVKEISCSCGPTITRFEVKPDSGVRVRSIANLVDDIAMGLAKAGVRIEAPIPGKAAVGIEVPNAEPATVYFRNILEAPEFRNHKSRIAACLGADVSGRPVILDINKMPHLLVAGTTGSGKSVCINSIIMSILYKAKPDEVKLILIDPKKVEFAVYRDLPHLYCPIISDPKKAAGALNSAVNEMERRFELIEEVGVRNIAGYNEVTADDPARPYMPQMVIIIDELADLMMTASNEVETAICRLAQKARAAGMHLILGTQRPSTDVITGLIKANVPSRIAFTVTQSVDSRIIIDTVGAEKLIGRGDMLYSPVGTTKPLRVQGTFVSDGEVERVVTFLRENNERGQFDESFTRQIEIEAAKCAAGKKKGGGDAVDIDDFDGLIGGGSGGAVGGGRKDNEDPKFWEALEVAAGKDKIGTSALQRALNLGYGRAAKIIDRMEELGFVGPDPGTKQGRKVIITKQEYLEYRANGLPTNGGGGGGEADEVGDPGDFDEL